MNTSSCEVPSQRNGLLGKLEKATVQLRYTGRADRQDRADHAVGKDLPHRAVRDGNTITELLWGTGVVVHSGSCFHGFLNPSGWLYLYMASEVFPRPRRLYKYANLDTGWLILENETLRFTNPKDFNDYRDCSLDRVYFDITCEDLDPLVAEDLEILKREFFPVTIPPDLLNKAFKKSRENRVERAGVTCFSLNPNSEYMWAHYGGGHKGFCFEFNNHLMLRDRFPNLDIQVEGPVGYGIKESVNYCENKLLGTQMQFLSKRKVFEIEEEYRLITMAGAGNYEFSPQFLTCVTFGAKISEPDRETIISMCREKYPHLRFQEAVFQGDEVKYISI